MATASQIITKARKWTYTSATQYPDADGLEDLNIRYKKLIAYINQEANVDLFADNFYGTLNIGQCEYTKPQTNNSTKVAGMNNMLGVYVNYNTPILQTGTISTSTTTGTGTGTAFTQNFKNGDYLIVGTALFYVAVVNSDTSMALNLVSDTSVTPGVYTSQPFYRQTNTYAKARPERSGNLAYDTDYYRLYQPQNNPFYILYDTGIQIFPTPTSSVAFGLKIKATKDVPDLALSDTPLLDDNYHYLLSRALMADIYQSKGQVVEAQNASNAYEKEVQNTLVTIGDSSLEPFPYLLANTANYE